MIDAIRERDAPLGDDTSGVARSCFSTADLLAEQFTF
jgi:hypothetical protein